MKKIIFLDRDGVINVEPSYKGKDYITEVKEFEFLPFAIAALKVLMRKNFSIYIISNQGGIAKGLFTMKDLQEINDYMLAQLKKNGVRIAAVYYCPHRREDNCTCKKPKIGLFEKAIANETNIDKEKTFFIGDQFQDIMAAKNFGCKSILVLSGKSKISDLRFWQFNPDYIAKDLYDAVINVVCPDAGRN